MRSIVALHVSTEKDEAIKDVAPKRTFQKKKKNTHFYGLNVYSTRICTHVQQNVNIFA